MAKYLQYFPKPLLDDLVQNRWVPIVGAGMSLNASVRQGEAIPLWKDLGARLAEDLSGYGSEDPLDVVSAYEHRFSRVRLIERLTQLLGVERSDPGPAHRAFCSIPFDVVCTTNFDFLLERQYQLSQKYCRPVMDEEQLSIALDRDPLQAPQERRAVTLLKLHGDLHHPQRMTVTERDYEAFLLKYPLVATFLGNLLISRTAVLIGYSLDDPDFRQLWNLVGSRLGALRRPAYAITVDASESYVAKYQRRQVQTVSLPGSRTRMGKVLAEAFTEIAEYFISRSLAASQPVEEQSLQQFTLPPDAVSRLCFFSVPLRLNPFYREVVYPIARDNGFVPVSPDDVIAPGDAILPKVQAIIARAELVLVDVAGQSSSFELGFAVQKLGANRVLAVVEQGRTPPPFDVAGLRVARRPADPLVRGDAFVNEIRDWLALASRELEPQLAAEPARLLKKKEYRAAVVAAVTLLEATLREQLPGSEDPKKRPTPFATLLESAVGQQLLSPTETTEIRRWLAARNAVVHGRGTVNAKTARGIVQGVDSLLRRLRAETHHR